MWEPDRGPNTYYAWADPTIVLDDLVERQKQGANRSNSPFYEFPKARIGKKEMLPCQLPRIALRDITRATDTRTMRCALVPAKVVLTNKAPYFLFPRGDSTDVAYLLGVLSSLPLDWYARRFVEISMNFYVFNPFPVPRPAREHPLRRRVVALAGRLAAVDDRYAEWAGQVGVACGPLDAAVKADHVRERDAVVAHLYGLSAPQLTHVFETFHEGWAYQDQLAETLAWYATWAATLARGGSC